MNEEMLTDSLDKTPHQKFAKSLRIEQSNSEDEKIEDEEYRELLQKAQLHPIMPGKYNATKRAELREVERRLITGSDDPNVKISAEMLESIPTMSKRYSPDEKKALREFERKLLEGKDLEI